LHIPFFSFGTFVEILKALSGVELRLQKNWSDIFGRKEAKGLIIMCWKISIFRRWILIVGLSSQTTRKFDLT